jgi:hypothetical protein
VYSPNIFPWDSRPPDPGRTYLRAWVQQTTWDKGENVKSPSQHVNTHNANTHNPELHFSSYPHSFDIVWRYVCEKVLKFCLKISNLQQTSYCFSFYFPSDILPHVSYIITLFYNVLFKWIWDLVKFPITPLICTVQPRTYNGMYLLYFQLSQNETRFHLHIPPWGELWVPSRVLFPLTLLSSPPPKWQATYKYRVHIKNLVTKVHHPDVVSPTM